MAGAEIIIPVGEKHLHGHFINHLFCNDQRLSGTRVWSILQTVQNGGKWHIQTEQC